LNRSRSMTAGGKGDWVACVKVPRRPLTRPAREGHKTRREALWLRAEELGPQARAGGVR